MHLRTSVAGVLATALVVVVALPSVAAPGQLDPAFGTGGTVVTEFLSSYAGARALAVQPDGRAVAAGFAHTNDSILSDFALTRYDARGVPDPTFGVDGRLRTDFGGRFDEARDLAVDPGGRIVAGGRSCRDPGTSDEVCDVGLVRYTARGLLDRGFGRQGRVRTDIGADVGEGVRGVVLQKDGRVVAAGDTQGPGGSDVGLVRYRPDGRLERTFGVVGVVVTPVSPSTDEVGGLALGPGGRVLVAGTTAVAQSFGFLVSRCRLA